MIARGLIVAAAGLCLVGAVLVAQAAPVGKKDPASVLVADLEEELANLQEGYEKRLGPTWPNLQSQADAMIAKQSGKEEGLALKQMANLFAKIEQIKYASARFGMQVAKRILQEQFLQDGAAVKPDLRLKEEQAELLIKRAELRSLVFAYRFADTKWVELYSLIDQFVKPNQPRARPMHHQLATDAHWRRLLLHRLVDSVHEEQEELLEKMSESQAEVLLAHIDNVIDAATGCEECRAEEADEANFYTNPLQSEEVIEAKIEPLKGLEESYRETKAALSSVLQVDENIDEEDIGFQGESFGVPLY